MNNLKYYYSVGENVSFKCEDKKLRLKGKLQLSIFTGGSKSVLQRVEGLNFEFLFSLKEPK